MKIVTGPTQPCPFCAFITGDDQYVIVAEDQLCVAFINERQYERGAMLIMPRAHRETILDVSDDEIASAYRMAKRLAGAAVRGLGAIGVSVFQNNGLKSGQSVAHYHVHVVPRYETSDPKRNFRESDFETIVACPPGVGGRSDPRGPVSMSALFPRTRGRRVLLVVVMLLIVGAVVLAASMAWLDALGASPEGERLARIHRSPNFRDGAFQNPEVTQVGTEGSTWKMLKQWLGGHEQRVPPGPMPIVKLRASDFATPPASGLRATWLGHATVLVEIDGARILFDPVWARRASPSSIVGPKRFHEPPLAIEDLPPIDAILASHDHYDHLDRGVVLSIMRSPAQSSARFIVPLGVGAHLERWGVPPDRITELDWSESIVVGALKITATPARHFSGRAFTRNHTLWASWAVAGPAHRVFHSGDTGPFPGVAAIGSAHGPFDLTLIKMGAYGETWPDIHLTPEQAVDAHAQLRGKALLPIHWGTFNMAFHAWDEPAERVVVAASRAGARLIMPRPGESIEPVRASEVTPWWRNVKAR